MKLSTLDIIIIVASVALTMPIALLYTKRASKGTEEFFASGRSMPWWLLGTSMVATTFSTDTPNLITNLVREKGIAYNWVWWAFLLTGMMTVFFYAKMWRRSNVLTDLEFYEIRYSGKSAAFVRGFRAIYLGFFFNIVIMATVTLAAAKIANVLFGWSRMETVLACSIAAVLFSAASGLWGVIVTDLVQFVMAMTGSFAVAFYSLQHEKVGGLSNLIQKIDPATLSLLPDFNNWELTLTIFIIPLAVQWWSVWYPGAEPGGGSYIAQRMLAAKDEKHSFGATLWFNIAHYGLRPWPWIIVALCSMIVFPTLQDIQRVFPHVSSDLIGHDIAYPAMITFLPSGLLGLMIASLIAAYLSTMDTCLNWGASYLVHDFYRRFMAKDRTEKHYVRVARRVTALLMVGAAIVTFFLDSARASFDLLLSIGAGTGLIYILRWFWWRINAWSEISAMVCSFFVSIGIFILQKHGTAIPPHVALLANVGFTTAVWLVVTFLTPATSQSTLIRFYELVRPFGNGWQPIKKLAQVGSQPDSLPAALLGWFLGCTLVYSALFATGNFIYGKEGIALGCTLVFAISTYGLIRLGPKMFRRN